MARIDLNCDLGEGFGRWSLGDDDGLLEVVTSANVACGFHAGDAPTMRRVCEWAADRGVAVGAQVSYRDLAGFGRRRVDYEPAELRDEIIYQIAALDGFARVAGSRVSYVKPHGALYNAVVHHQEQATAVVEAIRLYDASLPVMGLPGSLILDVAGRAGVDTVTEAFADRGYTPQGTLVPRSQPGALLHDPWHVAERMVTMVKPGQLQASDGSDVAVSASSICVHGDSPAAVEMAVAVRRALSEAGIDVRPFVS